MVAENHSQHVAFDRARHQHRKLMLGCCPCVIVSKKFMIKTSFVVKKINKKKTSIQTVLIFWEQSGFDLFTARVFQTRSAPETFETALFTVSGQTRDQLMEVFLRKPFGPGMSEGKTTRIIWSRQVMSCWLVSSLCSASIPLLVTSFTVCNQGYVCTL